MILRQKKSNAGSRKAQAFFFGSLVLTREEVEAGEWKATPIYRGHRPPTFGPTTAAKVPGGPTLEEGGLGHAPV